MSTASFKFWFPRFFLYFLLLIHNDSLRFKNILLPQAPCQKLITTYGGQEQSIGCIPSFSFTQTSIPAKFQSFIRTCTPPYATKSTETIPQLSDAFSELFTSHFIEKNANPEARLQLILPFRKKARPNARLLHLPKEGQAAWQLTTWRPLSWVKW